MKIFKSLLELKSISTYQVIGRGTAFAVANPHECHDFSHLIGQKVKIDDAYFIVRGVERLAHTPPWKKGENIGLLVDEI